MKFLSLFILMLCCSCRENSEEQLVKDGNIDSTFFAPKIGEKLTYRETLSSVDPLAKKPLSSDLIQKQQIERSTVYEGLETTDGKTLHKFSVTINNQPEQGFFMDWNGESLALSIPSQNNMQVKPVPIAHIDMTVGTYLHWTKEPAPGSGARVVELSDVKVPAGTFHAYKVSTIRNQGDQIMIKDYWFAPRIGIVKGFNRTYSNGLLRNESTLELINISNEER